MRFLLVGFALGLIGSASVVMADEPAVMRPWSFAPIAKVNPPGPGSPIDAFLRAKLKAAKLDYAPPAERSTWLRRVTFDLTGLPPTETELQAFLADKSSTAYESVVDRLLASPRFGERAALFWLDAVRYAESDGYKADEYRPQAWRYRDYVITSYNADKPFDRFLMEQIAGDELAPDDAQALIATGFLRHSPYEYNAVNVEQKRQDLLNDITDTVGSAFLGLTVGCAKCHDHKTDPISQRDYYRLQAFFAGFSPVEKPLQSPTERKAYEAQLKTWEGKTAPIRKQMNDIEKPFREKAQAKERSRFPEEYSRLLDLPAEQLSPIERQLAHMVSIQVYSDRRVNPAQMKPEERAKWEGMAKQMATLSKEKPPEPPTAMTMSDVGRTAPPTKILKRGLWTKPGEEVTPGFPAEIDAKDAVIPKVTTNTSGRRLALAQWLVSDRNPLTPRVLVNRVWQQMFGEGIVATPADLGITGEKPTHPELLDWLANDFIHPASGTPWSVKRIYRQIALSDAYRQSSQAEDGQKIDPENHLLWRMPRKRLDGETLRDALLAVSGQLNVVTMGGPSVHPDLPAELKEIAKSWKPSATAEERNRRSVYVAVRRNMRYPLFALFDSPDRTEVCARRFVTTTAPQALSLLNDQIVLGYASSLGKAAEKDANGDKTKLIDRLFQRSLGRFPTSEERETCQAFLARHPGSAEQSVVDLAHAILNLNEFLYID